MSVATTVPPAAAQPPLRWNPQRHSTAQGTDERRDSGYVTQFPSPDRANTTVDGKARHVPSALTPFADLAEFDKSVDDATLSRFKHVHSQLEKPLLEYIRRKVRGKIYRPIALRLMVLGRSEDDANPCIVVLCPEQQSERIRKFFDKHLVRTLCQPEDGTLPSFKVFVHGRPPETKHAAGDIDVLMPIIRESEGYTTETYCGAPIVIRQPSGVEKRCTFGGVIKTAWSNGDLKLYGLTVGHLLLGDSEDDLTLGTESDGAERLGDLGFGLSDSESEADSDGSAEEEPGDETQPLRVMDELQLASADASTSWTALELDRIGSISKDSPQYQSTTTDAKYGEPKAYYDWALVDMVSYKPNRIRPRKLPHGEVQEDGAFKSGDLVIPASPSSSSGKRQSVVLVSGSEGLKRGSLSALPSRLLLGPGKEFVDALILNLDRDKQILDGDSGSWVVNERTLEVYGYVVAADAFGGGYIIPLVEAFRNIKDTLGCQSVDLATTIDMASAKLKRMRDMKDEPDMNGEPAATMAPILVEHSVLRGPPIILPPAAMAANMQHMAGAGQMMPQQMRQPNSNQLQQIVYQNLVQHTQPFTGICWQANIPIGDRMGKTMNLISNIALAMNGVDSVKAAEFGCSFEREMFHKSPIKEAYDQEMTNKIMDFYKKRQANKPNLQNALNANAQVQAQAQAIMNMQAQIGCGIGQGPQQGFQPIQHPIQDVPIPQQRQIGMAMGIPGSQARPQQVYPHELFRLSPQDKTKVAELAARIMNNASVQSKANLRYQLQQRLPPGQVAEFQAQGKDLLVWFSQNRAFQVLKKSINRLRPGNPDPTQAAIIQQQQMRRQQAQAHAQAQGQQGRQNQVPVPQASMQLRQPPQQSAQPIQTPVASTTAQPPFQFQASSPYGNPSYIGKPKYTNLQIPPARKKQKVTGQTLQSATPSLQISKKLSPQMNKESEPQAPPKALFVCKEPGCEISTVGFPTGQALQNHVQEKHTMPMKFIQENLALALGLEPDGTPRKDQKLQEPALAMSVTNSKQGQTPATLAATLMSTDVKLPTGSIDKPEDGKGGVKNETTPKLMDAKPLETRPPADPWSNSTIDPQSLMSNLGLENGGFWNLIDDLNVYRSLTPNDMPELSTDSGSSEPNSDIPEGISLEIDFGWHDVGRDPLLDMKKSTPSKNLGSLDGSGMEIDGSLLLDPSSGLSPDWDDYHVDFNKPFELDATFYSMETSVCGYSGAEKETMKD